MLIAQPIRLAPSRAEVTVVQAQQTSLRVWRGLCGLVLGALGGPVAAVAVALGYTLCCWILSGTNEIDREHDLQELQENMVWPVMGCAVVCACAGWATLAPPGKWSFARSLAFIFFVSVALWCM